MAIDIPFLEDNLTSAEKIMLANVGLGTTEAGAEECAYLPGRQTRMILARSSDLDAARYEKLSIYGWRRCGNVCYRNTCPDCKECIPLRINIKAFRPDRTQRRCLKRNGDLRVFRAPLKATDEEFQLYTNYVTMRHDKKEEEKSFELYKDFLTNSSFDGFVLHYRLPDGMLIGSAWCDLLPDAVSAIYTAFSPEESKRSLGIYSILRQIQLCRVLGKHYLQLGFYIKECRKMNYKTAFSACEYSDLRHGWHSVERGKKQC